MDQQWWHWPHLGAGWECPGPSPSLICYLTRSSGVLYAHTNLQRTVLVVLGFPNCFCSSAFLPKPACLGHTLQFVPHQHAHMSLYPLTSFLLGLIKPASFLSRCPSFTEGRQQKWPNWTGYSWFVTSDRSQVCLVFCSFFHSMKLHSSPLFLPHSPSLSHFIL